MTATKTVPFAGNPTLAIDVVLAVRKLDKASGEATFFAHPKVEADALIAFTDVAAVTVDASAVRRVIRRFKKADEGELLTHNGRKKVKDYVFMETDRQVVTAYFITAEGDVHDFELPEPEVAPEPEGDAGEEGVETAEDDPVDVQPEDTPDEADDGDCQPCEPEDAGIDPDFDQDNEEEIPELAAAAE